MRKVRTYVSPEFRDLVYRISLESGLAPYQVTKIMAIVFENSDELKKKVYEVLERCHCNL